MERRLNRKVLLGVTGSIAAFKAAALVRELVKAGAEVQVVMTPAAHDFVTPLTLATLSGRPVLTELVAGLPGLRLDATRPATLRGSEFRQPDHLWVVWDTVAA